MKQQIEKVLNAVNENDIETIIDGYVLVLTAFLVTVKKNKTLVSKFVMENKSIILAIANVGITVYEAVTTLAPQLRVFKKKVEALEKEWDSSEMEWVEKEVENLTEPLVEKYKSILKDEED